MLRSWTTLPHLTLGLVLTAGSLPAHAQETKAPSVGVELNGVQQTETGCRLTFVAANRLGQDIGRAAYEVALFGTDGLVKRLTVLDFKDLPDGETRVRQFQLPDLECANLGRILVNGSTACDGAMDGACMQRLEATTRSPVAFGK